MIGCRHVHKPKRSSPLRRHEGGGRGGEGAERRDSSTGSRRGSVWARAARPSPEAHEREASVLAAIDRLRAKLEPLAERSGMEWDDIQPFLMRINTRTLEAANENPESLLLLLSQRMQSRRSYLSLDGIGEAGEIGINSKNTPGVDQNAVTSRIGPPGSALRLAFLEESSGERASVVSIQASPPMHHASLQSDKVTDKVIDKVTRALRVLYLGFNSIIAQFVLYVVYVLFFQALISAVRIKEEVYLTKYLVDNIIEEPISEDYDNDQFMSIANLGDIDLFVSGVLLPALVVDTRMDESFKTPFEMAETFDNLDWSAGLMIKQVRVAEHDQGKCGAVETGAVMRWFAESQVYI